MKGSSGWSVYKRRKELVAGESRVWGHSWLSLELLEHGRIFCSLHLDLQALSSRDNSSQALQGPVTNILGEFVTALLPSFLLHLVPTLL